MTPERQGQAGLAVLAAAIRLRQLVEAVAPLDAILDGTELEPVGHRLGNALVRVNDELQKLADRLAPRVPQAPAGPASGPEDKAHGQQD